MAVQTQGTGEGPHHEVPRILGPYGRPARGGGNVAILVPKRKIPFRDLLRKARQEGGALHEYVRREKGTSKDRLRRMAAREQHFQQDNRSDVQRVGVVPAREYMRWMQHDRHFWSDPANIEEFIRDNPECRPWKSSASRYVQGVDLPNRKNKDHAA